jgi:hypothetical protein
MCFFVLSNTGDGAIFVEHQAAVEPPSRAAVEYLAELAEHLDAPDARPSWPSTMPSGWPSTTPAPRAMHIPHISCGASDSTIFMVKIRSYSSPHDNEPERLGADHERGRK